MMDPNVAAWISFRTVETEISADAVQRQKKHLICRVSLQCGRLYRHFYYLLLNKLGITDVYLNLGALRNVRLFGRWLNQVQ